MADEAAVAVAPASAPAPAAPPAAPAPAPAPAAPAPAAAVEAPVTETVTADQLVGHSTVKAGDKPYDHRTVTAEPAKLAAEEKPAVAPAAPEPKPIDTTPNPKDSPFVRRMKATIDSLQRQVSKLTAKPATPAATPPGGTPPTPQVRATTPEEYKALEASPMAVFEDVANKRATAILSEMLPKALGEIQQRMAIQSDLQAVYSDPDVVAMGGAGKPLLDWIADQLQADPNSGWEGMTLDEYKTEVLTRFRAWKAKMSPNGAPSAPQAPSQAIPAAPAAPAPVVAKAPATPAPALLSPGGAPTPAGAPPQLSNEMTREEFAAFRKANNLP